MTTEPVLWVREDHTKAKHELLLAFFNKWVSIHSEYFTARREGVVRIYDGFAGPGVYTDGEAGSPRIMLEALLVNPNLANRWTHVTYEFSFVEQDPRRAKRLQEELEVVETAARDDGRWTDRITWTVTAGRYEEQPPRDVRGLSALSGLGRFALSPPKPETSSTSSGRQGTRRATRASRKASGP